MKKLFKMLLVVALVFGFMSCNNDVSETTTLDTIEKQLLILGRVTDANRASVGVSGVQVTLAGGFTRGDYTGTETVTTDSNGFYVFDSAVSEDSDFMILVEDASGTYISYKSTIDNSSAHGVTAANAYTLLYGEDYLDVATTVEMEDQVQLLYDANVPDISTTAFLEVELIRSFTFTGTIRGNEKDKELNVDNSTVIPGAIVMAEYTLPDIGSTIVSTTADDDGVFTLTNLPENLSVDYMIMGFLGDENKLVYNSDFTAETILIIDDEGNVTSFMDAEDSGDIGVNEGIIIDGIQNSAALSMLSVGDDDNCTFVLEQSIDMSEGALLVSSSLETQGEVVSGDIVNVAPADGIVAPSFTFTMDQSVSFEDDLYWDYSSVKSGGVLIDFDVTLTDTYETDEDGVILTEDADNDSTTAETPIVETANNVITITPKLPLNYGKTYTIEFTVENAGDISTTVTKTFTTTSEAEAELSAPVINRMSSVDFDTTSVTLEFLRANFYEDEVSFKVFASIDTDDSADSAAGTDWYEVHDASKTFTDVDFDYETEEDTISIDFSSLEGYTGITDLFDTRKDNSGIVNFRIFAYNTDNISSATEFTLQDIRSSVELTDTIGRNISFDAQNTIAAIVRDADGNYVSGTNTLNLVSDLYTVDTDYDTNDGSDISDEEIIFETSNINFQETVTVVLTDGIADADVNVTWVFTNDTHTTGRVIVTRPDDETTCSFVTTDSITLTVTDLAGNKLSVATDTSDSDDTELYPASGYVAGTFTYKAYDSAPATAPSVAPVVADVSVTATGDVLATN